MSDPRPDPAAGGPRGGRGALASLLLLAAALLLTFAVLELGVRAFVDFDRYRPIGVHHVDPEKVWAYVPGSERTYETSEFRFTVVANRFGRRDTEWSEATLADPGNVLFIGDSFVHGNAVEDEFTIPTLLEGRFAARNESREVFNFGMPATGPLLYRLMLEEAIRIGIEARTVVVGLFLGNDFHEGVLRPLDLRGRRPPPQEGFFAPGSQLVRFIKLRLANSSRTVGLALEASRLLGIRVYDTAGSVIYLRNPTPEQRATFDRILSLVGALQETAERHGRTLLVVLLPDKIQVENAEELSGAIFDAELPNRRILAWCRQVDVPCLDLLPRLREEYARTGTKLYFPIDRHLNEAGTRVAAEEIGTFLEARGEPARP